MVAVLAVLAAALPSLNAHPTYVGKSALVLSSPGRSPEQDAIRLLHPYNKPATIARFRAKKRSPVRVGGGDIVVVNSTQGIGAASADSRPPSTHCGQSSDELLAMKPDRVPLMLPDLLPGVSTRFPELMVAGMSTAGDHHLSGST